MSLVSIIVPIYNVEAYLNRCLDSLITQTLKNIEIILINDGSKDNSLQICEDYAKRDGRIKVIDQPNQGVSVARNTGLLRATGKYIGFVDPDDWIEPNMYELMYNKITELECPICFCNYYKDDKNTSSPKSFRIKKELLYEEEVRNMIVSNMVGADDIIPRYNYVMGCVWRGLYEKTFIDKYNLYFEPGVNIMEDLVFNIKALLKVDKLCILHEHLYHYVQNPTSILHTYKKNMWKDQIRVHELLELYIKEAGLEEQMRNRLDMRYVGMAFSAIYNEVNSKGQVDMKNKMNKVREICADEKLKESLERVRPIRGSELEYKVKEQRNIKILSNKKEDKSVNKKHKEDTKLRTKRAFIKKTKSYQETASRRLSVSKKSNKK